MNPLRTVCIPDSQCYCFRPYALWSSTLVYYIPSLFLDLISNHLLNRRSGLHLSVFQEGFGTKCAGFSSWHLIHTKQMMSSSNSWISKPLFTLIWPRSKITSSLDSLYKWACLCALFPPEWIAKTSSSVFPNHFQYLFPKEEIHSYNMENDNSRGVFMCLLSPNAHGNPVK